MTRINIGKRAFLAWLARNPHAYRRPMGGRCPIEAYLDATGMPGSTVATYYVWFHAEPVPKSLPQWASTGIIAFDSGLPAKEAFR